MPLDHIVIDIETKSLLKDSPLHLLEMSCAVVYDFNEDKYNVYGDTKGELEDLKNRILKADRVTSWGGWKFDFPVIWRIQSPHKVIQLTSTNDDLRSRVYLSQGLDPEGYEPEKYAGWSLNQVSIATLGCEGKSGNGTGAPALYKAGQWGRLVDYCIQDVKLTKELCEHADKTGYLLGKNGLYAKIGKDWQK